MNTPNSMALGWGSLLLAGGVAYYFAKKDINDRRDREHRRRLAGTSGTVYSKSQPTEKVDEDTTPRYRLAKGTSTQGRDRGDRL